MGQLLPVCKVNLRIRPILTGWERYVPVSCGFRLVSEPVSLTGLFPVGRNCGINIAERWKTGLVPQMLDRVG